ncbi:SigE family RNA polymerase sigma factor [Micromonospora sp. NPDC053740]|uniref:SigE family RNA polymerase sigma factor n=1 Tax=Micromonospora TaxID=1873 RepID=UPI001EE89102|nr:SigE family RNA polymerase sigma factor [Micromonospora alfalfae]MCG5462750.1 SigE family RNA polymerase sigma factor [Micromonospora alfalfae]
MTDQQKPLSAADRSYVAFVEVAWQRHIRLAMLLSGDRWRAEELLQDSLVKVYERWRRLSRLGDPHAYLRRALVNNHTSAWRRRRRESLFADVPDRAAAADGVGPDAVVLRRALMSLPAKQRAVVVLRHYEDLSEREVAQVLGCSLGTVKSQNARALGKLRHLLEESFDSVSR